MYMTGREEYGGLISGVKMHEWRPEDDSSSHGGKSKDNEL